MSTASLLVELLCEELPPRALRRLGEAFAEGIVKGLQKREMLAGAASGRGDADSGGDAPPFSRRAGRLR